MPRRGTPHLWLRKARGARAGGWIIIDGGRQIATGCRGHEKADAENKLLEYVQAKEAAKRPLYLYFLTTEQPGFPIKIGTTVTHKMRMAKLQTGLPFKIKILALMPIKDELFERRLHRKFHHLRLSGEWFQATEELTSYIDELVGRRIAA